MLQVVGVVGDWGVHLISSTAREMVAPDSALTNASYILLIFYANVLVDRF